MPTTILASQGDTIISQGRFVSTGSPQTLVIPSGFSWIRVINETKAYADEADDFGVEYYFQVGMDEGQGVVWTKIGSDTDANHPLTISQIDPNDGFTPFTSAGDPLGAPIAITAGTNATQPVFSTASTAGLTEGSIVRITGTTGQLDLSGYDWAIDTIVEDTSFRIAATLQQAPGATSAAGNYRIVKFNPLFYPRDRFICNAQSDGQNTVLTLTVPSGYIVGQKVRVYMPSAFGMRQIDKLEGTIVSLDDTLGTQTITLNINSSSFDPFTFPLAALNGRYSPAMVVPIGINTAEALGLGPDINILSDSVTNTGIIGVTLAAGDFSPAGNADDVISWLAGTSVSNVSVTP